MRNVLLIVLIVVSAVIVPGLLYQDAFDTCMKNHSEFTCRNSLK